MGYLMRCGGGGLGGILQWGIISGWLGGWEYEHGEWVAG